MAALDGRVAIVTGAGRGLGREHALLLAAEGAAVVVNDLGGDVHGKGVNCSPALSVVHEIQSSGGRAIASGHDVSDWEQAGELVKLAIEYFGALHVLVNNAGILRDRTLANTTEADWDAVVRVHLRGHGATAHHALAYWRDQAKAGRPMDASVIHTASISGLRPNFGQANYGAAKLGVVGLSGVIALEGAKYGVRSNAVSPSARTRLTLAETNSEGSGLGLPDDPGAFDPLDPANVSPLVAWLARSDCPATGQIFQVLGNRLLVFSLPQVVADLATEGRWTIAELDKQLPSALIEVEDVNTFLRMHAPALGF